MRYRNLNKLIYSSSSTRRYFLSLPVNLQMELHNYNDFIHTAAELHRFTELLEKYNKQVILSEYYPFH